MLILHVTDAKFPTSEDGSKCCSIHQVQVRACWHIQNLLLISIQLETIQIPEKNNDACVNLVNKKNTYVIFFLPIVLALN